MEKAVYIWGLVATKPTWLFIPAWKRGESGFFTEILQQLILLRLLLRKKHGLVIVTAE
jgi:hypothetical protein